MIRFTIVSNWYDIAMLLNILTPDGFYAVTGPDIREMFSGLPNTVPGISKKGAFDSMISRWRRDFWTISSEDAKNKKGFITGGGRKFFTEKEEECIVKKVQEKLLTGDDRPMKDILLEAVREFVGLHEDHEHALRPWCSSWLTNFMLRHKGEGIKRSLTFTPTINKILFPEAILTPKGLKRIAELETIINVGIFTGHGEDLALIGSNDNRVRHNLQNKNRTAILAERRRLAQKTQVTPVFQEVICKRRKKNHRSESEEKVVNAVTTSDNLLCGEPAIMGSKQENSDCITADSFSDDEVPSRDKDSFILATSYLLIIIFYFIRRTFFGNWF
jgi:hypothetical protein